MNILTQSFFRWWLFFGLVYFGSRALAADAYGPESDFGKKVHDTFVMAVDGGRVQDIKNSYNELCDDPPSCTHLHQAYKKAILESLYNSKPHSTVALIRLGFKIDEKDMNGKTPLQHAAEECRADLAFALRVLGADEIYGSAELQKYHSLVLEKQNEKKTMKPLPNWDYEKDGRLKPAHQKELEPALKKRQRHSDECDATAWILQDSTRGGLDLNKVKQMIESENFKELHAYLKRGNGNHGIPDEEIDEMVFDPEDRTKTSELHRSIYFAKLLSQEHLGIFSGGSSGGGSGVPSTGGTPPYRGSSGGGSR